MSETTTPASELRVGWLSLHRGRLRWLDGLIAMVLLVGYTSILAMSDDMGFTRDESFYFRAARDYMGWFDELADNLRDGRLRASFTQQNVDQYWSYNPEHPVLMKSLFAVSYLLLHHKWELLSPSLAMRLPAMASSGLLIALIYLMAMEMTGRRLASLSAAMAMAWMPHWFFHSHLTCFDVPITTAWFAVVYAWWKSLDNGRWAIATGVLWGVALTCKLNAFFLPIVFLLHWGLGGLSRFRVSSMRLTVPPVPASLFWMAMLGPLILYLGWPRHWFDTFNRLSWYLNFHLGHEHYYVLYFGQNLFKPPFPFEYPFVMSGITTPLVILWAWIASMVGLALVSVVRLQSRTLDPFGTGVLLALNIAIPFLIIARPSTPIFGGIKHWFAALPYLCLLVAVGIAQLQSVLRWQPVWMGRAFASTGLVCITAGGAVATWQCHPFGISYYNELLGGITGGADAGAMRQFWGYESRHALEWLNEHAPSGAQIHWHETTGYAVDMYREEGWLRPDLQNAWSIQAATFVVFEHDKGFVDFLTQVWDEFETFSPVYIVTLHGVPLLSVYANSSRVDLEDLATGGWNDGVEWRTPDRVSEPGDGGDSSDLHGSGIVIPAQATDDPGVEDGSAKGGPMLDPDPQDGSDGAESGTAEVAP